MSRISPNRCRPSSPRRCWASLPTDDPQLKDWSADFAEMLGNFQHNPDRVATVLRAVEEMSPYFRDRHRANCATPPREGLIHSLLTAEVDGDRLTEEEVIANSIVTMVGGQETTTNLIGNGLLTLLRHPEEMQRLREDCLDDPALIRRRGRRAAALSRVPASTPRVWRRHEPDWAARKSRGARR